MKSKKSIYVYLFTIALCFLMFLPASAQFTQEGSKLVGTDASSSAKQGISVSLSADGNTAIVGGYTNNSDTGAAFVYIRSGGVWTQQGNKLVGTGAVGKAIQGWSVDISADGNTAIVGGPFDNSHAGAVWVYTRSGGVWTQQGSKLVGTGAVGYAKQGSSVSISADGNTAIVGGENDNGGAGVAWIYTRSGGVWTQQGSKLVGTGAVGSAMQGVSVSLSADGNTAIVGGWYDNSLVGAAWVYTQSGGVWTQEGSKLVGTGANGNARQGISVSLTDDGNTAIVGGQYDNANTGAAWIFTRSGGTWTQQGSKLVGSDAVGNAEQGRSVSLSGDGMIAAVGGYADNSSAGAAWIFTQSGGTWTQQGSKLVGTDAVGSAQQGISVSIAADGNTLIVGGIGDNAYRGAAWVYSYCTLAVDSIRTLDMTLCYTNDCVTLSPDGTVAPPQEGVQITGGFKIMPCDSADIVLNFVMPSMLSGSSNTILATYGNQSAGWNTTGASSPMNFFNPLTPTTISLIPGEPVYVFLGATICCPAGTALGAYTAPVLLDISYAGWAGSNAYSRISAVKGFSGVSEAVPFVVNITSCDSTNISVSLGSDSVITVIGKQGPNDIRVRLDSTATKVEIDDRDTGTDPDTSFQLSLISSIHIFTGSDNDRVIFDDTYGIVADALPFWIDAGDGDDVIFGGTGDLTPDDVEELPIIIDSLLIILAGADSLSERADQLMLEAVELAAIDGVVFIQKSDSFITAAQQFIIMADSIRTLADSEIVSFSDEFLGTGENVSRQADGLTDIADAFTNSGMNTLFDKFLATVDSIMQAVENLRSLSGIFAGSYANSFIGNIQQLVNSAKIADTSDCELIQSFADSIDYQSISFADSADTFAVHTEGNSATIDTVFEHLRIRLEWVCDSLLDWIQEDFGDSGEVLLTREKDLIKTDSTVLVANANSISGEAELLDQEAQSTYQRVSDLICQKWPDDCPSNLTRQVNNFSGKKYFSLPNFITGGGRIIWGSKNDDIIKGKGKNDIIFGKGGNDSIYGGGGKDILFGNKGNDALFGGDSADFMFGDTGSDWMFGEAGGDFMWGNDDNDHMDGGNDNDLMWGNNGEDIMQGRDNSTATVVILGATITVDLGDLMWGNGDDDEMYGNSGCDIMFGNDNNDHMRGNDGVDFMWGGDDDDQMHGDLGRGITIEGSTLFVGNFMFGNGGNDEMWGDVDTDFMWGNADNDRMSGDSSADFIWGDDGVDIIWGSQGNDFIWGNQNADTLFGEGDIDFIFGNEDSDKMFGGPGIDFIWGNNGNDGIMGNEGADFIWGNQGNDWLSGDDGSDFLWGNDDDDNMYGGEHTDFMWGNKGKDGLNGGDGSDFIWGNEEADHIYGDAGYNFMWGNAGNDWLYGGNSTDFMWGNEDVDWMHGRAGTDFMWGNEVYDWMWGEDGGDFIWGNQDNDMQLDGGNGNDFIWGNDGNDRIFGDVGNNFLWGNQGRDHMVGGDDVDFMWGNDSIDYMWGGNSTDFMWGNQGDDVIWGNLGADVIWGNQNADTLSGDEGNDLLFGNEDYDNMFGNSDYDLMFGNRGSDCMSGGDSTDFMFGNDDNDNMFGNGGPDLMIGNAGDDHMDGGGEGDFMFGNNDDDGMLGNDGDDFLWGNRGIDMIDGGIGNDYISGGIEYNVLFGGPGNDITICSTGSDCYPDSSSGVTYSPCAGSIWGIAYIVPGGWGISAVPTREANYLKMNLFPDAVSSAFTYSGGGYVEVTQLENGKGYWIKQSSSTTVTFAGSDLSVVPVLVSEGWNMIGSISTSMPISNIISDPPGITTSQVFGYNGAYQSSDNLIPGYGYWIKVNSAGTLILSATYSPELLAKNAIRIVPNDEMPPPPPEENISAEVEVPKEYILGEAYPNPFNPSTRIDYQLPADSRVTLKVYNVLGQVTGILKDEIESAGYKTVIWKASSAASGIYFYRLDATNLSDPGKSFTQVKKVLLLK